MAKKQTIPLFLSRFLFPKRLSRWTPIADVLAMSTAFLLFLPYWKKIGRSIER